MERHEISQLLTSIILAGMISSSGDSNPETMSEPNMDRMVKTANKLAGKVYMTNQPRTGRGTGGGV